MKCGSGGWASSIHRRLSVSLRSPWLHWLSSGLIIILLTMIIMISIWSNICKRIDHHWSAGLIVAYLCYQGQFLAVFVSTKKNVKITKNTTKCLQPVETWNRNRIGSKIGVFTFLKFTKQCLSERLNNVKSQYASSKSNTQVKFIIDIFTSFHHDHRHHFPHHRDHHCRPSAPSSPRVQPRQNKKLQHARSTYASTFLRHHHHNHHLNHNHHHAQCSTYASTFLHPHLLQHYYLIIW